MATVAEVAAHLDLSERRVYEYQPKGVIAKAAPGEIDLEAARVAYIRHLRELASGRPQEGELDPAQERARKDRALAVQTELKNDVARGEVVEIEAVGMQVSQIFTVIRAKFLGLPSMACSRFGTDRRTELHTLLQDMVCEILTELSSPEGLPAVKEARAKQTAVERRENEKRDREREQVLYSWATESDGFLSLSDDGAMVTFSRRERTFATDLRNYLDASGKVTNRFTFPTGGRLYAVLTDVRTNAFPAGARDTAGRAKGDAAFDWQGACPCFLAQKFMLAVNGTFIDRYTYGGVYVDRKTLPFGYKATAAPNALATLRWQHVGGPPVSSGAAPGFNSYYLPHSNLLAMPYDSTTGPYNHMASTDEGVTWRRVQIQFYQAPAGTPQIVLNVGAWAGLHPYFPT